MAASWRKVDSRPILRQMRLTWPRVALIGLIGGAIAIAAAFILSFGGCSVDENAYVARNEAVYRTVPEYPGAVLVNSYSIGIPKPGGLNENGPPYSAFDTWHVYRLSAPVPLKAVIRHFENLSGWDVTVRVGNPPNQLTLRKGNASIYVVASTSGYEVNVDYDGYGGPGH